MSTAAVDLDHLDRYTGGNRVVNTEILQLFAEHSAQLMLQLQTVLEARDAKTWRHITHSLKGAARGIGAFALADVAAEAEPLDPAAERAEALKAVMALRARTQAVQDFIQVYLGL
jgi:HPt (histidine-containing phosphotransfer) domain-containing protein